tara:strand:+ start:51 stop:344 length:294 start_codon:yes stop_codon:yes gene_type:complete
MASCQKERGLNNMTRPKYSKEQLVRFIKVGIPDSKRSEKRLRRKINFAVRKIAEKSNEEILNRSHQVDLLSLIESVCCSNTLLRGDAEKLLKIIEDE